MAREVPRRAILDMVGRQAESQSQHEFRKEEDFPHSRGDNQQDPTRAISFPCYILFNKYFLNEINSWRRGHGVFLLCAADSLIRVSSLKGGASTHTELF